MQAFLLSAGEGKRLRPLTRNKPKCLISIYKSCTLKKWILELDKYKFKKIYINVNYKKEQIIRFVKKLPKKIKCKIFLIEEKKLLGTFGSLKKNIKLFETDDLLLVHSDNYMEEDLKNFLKKSRNNKSTIFSMLTFYTNDTKNSGIVKINEKNMLLKFYEKKNTHKYGFLANAGVFFIKKIFFKKINYIKGNDFSKDIVPKFLGKVNCVLTKKKFTDIGTIKNLLDIKKYRKKCFSQN
jgi:mannose-1-phosphate guanylyltransferase